MKNTYQTRGIVTIILLRRKSGEQLKALIDTADLPRIKKLPVRWYAAWDSESDTFYVHANGPTGTLCLHRVILDAPKGFEVDHLFHDGLDNRRGSLRVVTPDQNKFNRRKQRNNVSGHRGVIKDARSGKWLARVRHNKKNFYLGYFSDADVAGKVVARFIERKLYEHTATSTTNLRSSQTKLAR